MIAVTLSGPDDQAGWRAAAFALEAAGVPPECVNWVVAGEMPDLFASACAPAIPPPIRPHLAIADTEIFDAAVLHSDPERFVLAYQLFWRLREAPGLLSLASDPTVVQVGRLAKATHRDMHKMKAFVRFREVAGPDGAEAYVAWFEPDHHIVRATAPFFMRRFAGMIWSILTPEINAHWDGAALRFGPGARRDDVPDGDVLEELWRTYFGATFNPARLKVKAMQSEMPKKYWRNLPEASLISPLIRDAHARVNNMIDAASRDSFDFDLRRTVAEAESGKSGQGPTATLGDLRDDMTVCQRCSLHQSATHSVPGEGPQDAEIVFVGEQPGDQEDLSARPFVGPAGKVFDVALQRVGIDRSKVYVTNAVKHFKFARRGKRRIHEKPNAGEVKACRWWLNQELQLIRPRLVVALGATAALGMTGRPVKVSQERSIVCDDRNGPALLITVHPSYLLRLQDEQEKRVQWRAFLNDLQLAREWVERGTGQKAH